MHLTLPAANVLASIPGFEGPEKKLEIDFRCVPGDALGFRAFNEAEWQVMLDSVKCKILSHTPNKHFDSFVLSESSLFVYPYKLILKTCGTTTLLRCLPIVLKMAERLNTEIDFVFFSRKNFIYPEEQHFPHSSFDAEVSYLDEVFPGAGAAHVFGPVSGDHWVLYAAELQRGPKPAAAPADQTLEIMMHDLDPAVMAMFSQEHFRNLPSVDADAALPAGACKHAPVAARTGISTLMPGAHVDEFLFTPQGYSMNGLQDESYYTIHITPEDHCSFVSFETNLPLKNYDQLIHQVVELFRPGRFCVTLFCDRASTPSTSLDALGGPFQGFRSTHRTYTCFGDYNVANCLYSKIRPQLTN